MDDAPLEIEASADPAPKPGPKADQRRILALLVLIWVGYGAYQWDWAPVVTDPVQRKRLAEIRRGGRLLAPLHERKKPVQDGDWLVSFPEHGQTFNEWLLSDPPLPTATRTTLYVLPMGEFDKQGERLVYDVAVGLRWFYGLPVEILPPEGLDDLPVDAHRGVAPGGVQYRTGPLLDRLKQRLPDDATVLIGLTNEDLYPEDDWNYVFGQASLTDRVGIWSYHRFGGPDTDYTTILRRTLKVAIHETGHMFGIQHCRAWECGMNGSNSLEESERQVMWFCPQCEMKVWYATPDINPTARYQFLVDWADEHDLRPEAEFWRTSGNQIAPSGFAVR